MPQGVKQLYHGTSLENARIIRKEGFKVSTGGMLGRGVYLSASEDKAFSFAANKYCPAVLVCNVNLGKVIMINRDNSHM